jgi:GTP-binding protein Era
VEVALGTLKEVDVVMFLTEAHNPPGSGDEYILQQLQEIKTPVFLVLNKIDLISKEELLRVIGQYKDLYPFAEIIPVSALKGENTAHLTEVLINNLPEGPQYYPEGTITDRPETFIMSELIREKVLHLTSEEIPHSVTVVIDHLEEQPNDVVAVQATIYTERDSQKGILIGKGGSMLKRIGQLAREEMERLLGSRVYLKLWVKVRKDWRNQLNQLKNFGYHE